MSMDHLCNLVVTSWLQIQRSGFDSRRYQIFWELVSLERGPLSPVSTTEELLKKKISGFCLEIREYGSRDPSRWPRGTLYPQMLSLAWPKSGGLSVGTVFFSCISMNIMFKGAKHEFNEDYVFLEYDAFCWKCTVSHPHCKKQ
jgi:hypothetical protein